jgi:16S rRNA G966 N2-methylase RsmD
VSTETPYQLMLALSTTDYLALKNSIAENGVLVAVELDRDGHVIDGHHRVRACEELGIKDFPRVIQAGLSAKECRERALILNLTRRQLSRAQRADAVAKLRALGWSNRRIAEATGASEATVRRDARGASIDARGRVTGKDGKTYPSKRRPTSIAVTNTREQNRAITALNALEASEDGLPGGLTPLHRAEKLVRIARSPDIDPAPRRTRLRDIHIHHAAIDNLPVKPHSVDVILTDPPYTKRDLPIWHTLGEKAAEWLKPGGTLLAYTGAFYLPTILDVLGEHLAYRWTIAALRQGQQVMVRGRKVSSAWVPIVVFTTAGYEEKGRHLADVLLPVPNEGKEHHPWQKAVAETEILLSRIAPPGSLIVDPFLGSGTTAIAARNRGCRFIGGDIDKRHVNTARKRLEAAD